MICNTRHFLADVGPNYIWPVPEVELLATSLPLLVYLLVLVACISRGRDRKIRKFSAGHLSRDRLDE